MDYFDLIEDYLGKKLSTNDLASFEKELTQNDALASAVRNFPLAQQISESLIEIEARDTLLGLHSQSEGSQQDIPKPQSPWAMVVILLFLIGMLLFAFNFLNKANGNNPMAKTPEKQIEQQQDVSQLVNERRQYALQFYKPELGAVTRGSEPMSNERIAQAYTLVRKNNFTEAKTLAEEMAMDSETESHGMFLMGHINFRQGNHQEADDFFRLVKFGTDNEEKQADAQHMRRLINYILTGKGKSDLSK